MTGLTSELDGDKGGWRGQRGRTSGPVSPLSFRCLLTAVHQLKETKTGAVTPSTAPLNSSKLLGPRETLGLEGRAPLTSLLGCSVLVEAGRFQAEAEAVGAGLAVVRGVVAGGLS